MPGRSSPARVIRVLAGRPGLAVLAAGWAARFVRRAGLVQLLRGRARPVTFVMHSFMDARDVRPAWEALERGELLADPRLRGVQERLRSCSYAMAHPEHDRVVPACVQHSVLDPQGNIRLMQLLPLER